MRFQDLGLLRCDARRSSCLCSPLTCSDLREEVNELLPVASFCCTSSFLWSHNWFIFCVSQNCLVTHLTRLLISDYESEVVRHSSLTFERVLCCQAENFESLSQKFLFPGCTDGIFCLAEVLIYMGDFHSTLLQLGSLQRVDDSQQPVTTARRIQSAIS